MRASRRSQLDTLESANFESVSRAMFITQPLSFAYAKCVVGSGLGAATISDDAGRGESKYLLSCDIRVSDTSNLFGVVS